MKKMKKGSLWVLFVVVVFGIMMFFTGARSRNSLQNSRQ